ncbi:hypothetical protein SGFS_017350 [Streptomyces graminofaciens]|uniref:Lipoprotein n=1 Tax=Streptomyces graminofaciens TaxID=68212 RepID=A0ABN5VBQ2_9ACTN|nr:hypothetical protein [Streptomyces graminofaciens]BBC30441.1 hypothetical protein SGFS_017350 [Streptomyces graminofaciens]
MRIRTTAAVLLAAVLATGCAGGGSAGGGSDTKGRDGASAAARLPEEPAVALGADEVEAAALSGGDVEGFTITDYPVKPHGDSTARPPSCQPLENMRTGAPDPAPRTLVGRLAYPDSAAAGGSATTIGLMAYDRADAEDVLDGVRAALKRCTAYEGGVPARTTATAGAAPDTGDDAVAFSLQTEGHTADAFVIVRSGATVVLFFTASGTDSPAQVPDALVAEQIKKLEQA